VTGTSAGGGSEYAGVRIGVVADIHCGPDSDTQVGSRAPALLGTLVDAMRAYRPQCIVDLGDRVNSVTRSQDLVRTRYVRQRLRECGVPVYHVLGNTDVAHVPAGDSLAALEATAPYGFADHGGWRLLFLNSVDPAAEGVGGTIGRVQLAWLEAALLARGSPCLVFCHHPLDEQSVGGHRYFATRPDLAGVQNRAEVRAVLQRSGRVRAVFMGHMHWSRATRIEAIPYITLGSLVDRSYTEEPSGAFAFVTASPGAIDVRVRGHAPVHFLLES
jgi:3',5'-cyclic-AMP phosphodiesterase